LAAQIFQKLARLSPPPAILLYTTAVEDDPERAEHVDPHD
jgi:hypothetical protein